MGLLTDLLGGDNATSGAMSVIAETKLAAAAASIDFASIPTTFRHLRLVVSGRTDRAAGRDGVRLRFNGDATATYDVQGVYAAGNGISHYAIRGQTAGQFGDLAAANAVATRRGSAELVIPNYLDTAFTKTATATGGVIAQTTITTDDIHVSYTINWRSTEAINRITVIPESGPNFVAGTLATLYGMNGV